MKKTMFITMLFASMVLTACSINDPYSEYLNQGGFNWGGNGGFEGNNGTYAVSLTDFTIDKTTAEPTTTASAYYPEDEAQNSCHSESL